jgi:hypothetical protein
MQRFLVVRSGFFERHGWVMKEATIFLWEDVPTRTTVGVVHGNEVQVYSVTTKAEIMIPVQTKPHLLESSTFVPKFLQIYNKGVYFKELMVEASFNVWKHLQKMHPTPPPKNHLQNSWNSMLSAPPWPKFYPPKFWN